MIERRFLKIGEICAYLNIGKSTCYRYIFSKKLPFIKIGGCVRIDKKLLDEWLEKQRTGSGRAL